MPFTFLRVQILSFLCLSIPYFLSIQRIKLPTTPMKRQAADKLLFQQSLRKLPMVALTILTLTILLSLIISAYSPLYFRYPDPTTISQSTTGTFDSLESSTVRQPDNATEFEAKEPQEIEARGWPASSNQNDLPTTDANSNSLSRSSRSQEEEEDPELDGSLSGRNQSKWPDSPQGKESVIQKAPEQTDHLNTPPPPPTPTGQESCDLFSGEWVPNPEAPYYTNATCYRIQDHQNCMKYGRPDTDYLKWRWKPDGCDLPIFDPHQFLELVRGKSIAFVGDSVGRNHMQSLMCLLSRVVFPLDLSKENSENQHWVYKDYNFNISLFWAPYLVRSERTDPNDVTRPFNLYLDEYDQHWTTNVEEYKYIIISAGQWFFRPTLFYENRSLIGCHACKDENVTQLTSFFSYEKAFRTAFRAINSLKFFKGITFLRTITPSHFEGGVWDEGADCVRTRPFKRNETVLEDQNSELHRIQVQELRIAQEEGIKTGLRFRLLDATQCMMLRPDGHPSKYGHWPHEKKTNDCVHWCLPGPVDTLNDFLLELFKREEGKY